MHLHLKVIGIILLALAIIHVIFPKYFHWKKELTYLSLVNRQMLVVHTFFIALTVFLVGLLCLTSADELIETKLGRNICLGIGLFWTMRLYIQFFGYSSRLWKGKTFETTVHIFFIVLCTYLSYVFWTIGLS